MATKQRCPKCNAPNSLNAPRCFACKAPLRQVCPLCGTSRPWYVEQCPYCANRPEEAQAFSELFRSLPSQRVHGHYVIQETLATSRISAVYRVTDSRSPGSAYALKAFATIALFRPDERREAKTMFHETVRRWASLQHPMLPRICETFAEREYYYLLMELIEGWSLKRILSATHLRISPDLVRNWGAQLCALLTYLHSLEPPLYAPFLAPSHVMVTAQGELKLVDFGLTHLFSPNTYGPLGSVRGYAAPELSQEGLCSVQSDIFAVGRLLYALLTGQSPEKRAAQRLPLAQAVPGISPQLVKTIARATHREPARRFASAQELQRALWDELSGPLQPMIDWIERSMASPGIAPFTLQPGARVNEAMSQANFQRDPRFMPDATAREAGGAVQPKLSVHPHAFGLGDLGATEVRRLVLTLRNAGEGELVGHITCRAGWIIAPGKVWRLPAGKRARVILSVNAALMPPGRTHEPEAVLIESNGGRQWIAVSAEVASGPMLGVEQPALDYGVIRGDEERSLPLTLVNKGRQLLTGSITSRVPWLRVPHPLFRCPPGQSVRVPVTLLPGRLPRGPQTEKGALVIDSDGGQAEVEVRAWRQKPELELGATHMDFGTICQGEVAKRHLYIGNAGDGLLEGTVRSLIPWLQASPQAITCSPGELVQVTLTVDSVGLPDGPLDLPQALRVQSNGGTGTLSLHLQVRAPKLALVTNELSFGDVPLGETRERPLIVRNEGSAPLAFTLQSLVEWLVPSQKQFTCEPAGELSIGVRAETSRFLRGQEVIRQPGLRLISGANITDIPVSITVLQPILRVEPAWLDFGYIDRAQPEIATLTIANDGTGKMAWNAQTDVQWLEFSPRAGVCEAGRTCTLTLTAYGLALEAGLEAAQGTLIIHSDGGRAKVPLRLALAAPRLEVDTTLIDLGTSINKTNVSGSLGLFNRGLGLLRGSMSVDQTWLTVNRASFELPTGHSIEVQIGTDMEEFPSETFTASGLVRIESNGGTREIEVRVKAVLCPHLVVADDALLLERHEPEGIFQGRLIIRNTGRAVAHTRLMASTAALILSRERCDIKPDKTVRIVARWEGPRPAEPTDNYVDILCGEQLLRVPVRFEACPSKETAAHIAGSSLQESSKHMTHNAKEVGG